MPLRYLRLAPEELVMMAAFGDLKAFRWIFLLIFAVLPLRAGSSLQQSQLAPSPAAPKSNEVTTTPNSKPLLAEDVFRDVKVFKGKNASRVIPAMDALRRLLGVECTYCHTQYDWSNNSKPAKLKARQHFEMIESINHSSFADANAVSCWSCHRGSPIPPPYKKDEAAVLRANRLIALRPEDAEKPSQEVLKNIQTLRDVPAGHFPSIMAYFAASLGVGCDHCHVTGQFERDDKPEKLKARKMLMMVGGILRQYYGGNGPIGCYTCHQGKIRPEIEPGKATEAKMADAIQQRATGGKVRRARYDALPPSASALISTR
jgi:hypothetical protein